MKQSSRSSATTYWRIGLANGAVVIGAVALLLTVLARQVDQIEQRVARIWQVGKLIANNTVHIPALVRTNQLITHIYGAAQGITAATGRISSTVARSRS